jgi:hypothetical protein
MPDETLTSKALEIVPRVLGFCDRRKGSPTVGCCDRTCWHYRLMDRNPDGSVHEVYPYERSFCATSFTSATRSYKGNSEI